jgi:glycosyltransferase involved in cell wall biosynthesis
MNFSIILNTRERVDMLKDLLDSLANTTHDLSNIEVFICIDNNDAATLSNIDYLLDTYPFLYYLIVPPSENLHFNLNKAFEFVNGKYIIVLNDDCKFLNAGWDKTSLPILEDYLKDKPDGIVYGRTHDTSIDKGGTKEYASFPLLSTKAIQSTGFVMPEYVKGWGGDVLSWRIYQSVDRIVDLPDIQIEHLLHNDLNKIMNPDKTQNYIRVISAQNNMDYFTADITAHKTQLQSIICQKQEYQLKKGNKVCVVYNTCGISGNEKVNNYIHSIRTILNQDFDGAEIVISGCLNSQDTKDKLYKAFGSRIHYNWIDEKLPINVTFNHSCLEARSKLGKFDCYLYLDSGISLTDKDSLQKLFDLYKSDSYGMVSAQTSTDAGYQQWFDVGKHAHDTTENHKLFNGGDFVVPVGKAVNLHCQIFDAELLDYYSGLMPDIFASYCTESTFTFLCAALNKKWVISKDVMTHHHISMDGASSGFDPVQWRSNNKPTWNHPFKVDCIMEIMLKGKEFGMGYEECQNIMMHNPDLYDKEGFCINENLKTFIKDNLFLINKNILNYNEIKNQWVYGK